MGYIYRVISYVDSCSKLLLIPAVMPGGLYIYRVISYVDCCSKLLLIPAVMPGGLYIQGDFIRRLMQ